MNAPFRDLLASSSGRRMNVWLLYHTMYAMTTVSVDTVYGS